MSIFSSDAKLYPTLYKSIKIVFSQFQHRPQFKALNEGSIVSLLEKLALSVLDLTWEKHALLVVALSEWEFDQLIDEFYVPKWVYWWPVFESLLIFGLQLFLSFPIYVLFGKLCDRLLLFTFFIVLLASSRLGRLRGCYFWVIACLDITTTIRVSMKITDTVFDDKERILWQFPGIIGFIQTEPNPCNHLYS